MNAKEELQQEISREIKEEEIPARHFTEKDLQEEWQIFLDDLMKKDDVAFYAVNTLKLSKSDENEITILYPSDSAKTEFEKIREDFFNHFKRKVNNYKIEIVYKNDTGLKKEIPTKRKIFDKFAGINPVLRDLEELFRFDLD